MKVVGRLFAPAQWVMRRLSFAQKFLVMAVVLAAPLAYVTSEYRSEKNASIAFSAKERDGVEFVAATADLAVATVQARSAAVLGSVPDTGAIDAATAELDRLDQVWAQELPTASETWSAAKDTLLKAKASSGTGQDAYDVWTTATTAINTFFVEVSNATNLTLDPDLDSYYVMDAVMFRTVPLIDAIGQSVDLQSLQLDATGDAAVSYRVDLAPVRAAVTANALTIEADLKAFTFKATNDATIKPALEAPLNSVVALATKASDGSKPFLTGEGTKEGLAANTAIAEDALTAVADFAKLAGPALDGLLATRVGGFEEQLSSVTTILVIALAIAVFLFFGLIFSVSASVRPVVTSLRDAADGDFHRPVIHKGRDEIVKMARAVDEMFANLEATMLSIARSSESLARSASDVSSVSTQIASNAGDTSFQAETVATATEEMNASIREIAQGSVHASDVARNAAAAAQDTDSTMASLDRRSNEIVEVVEVISEIAEQTNLLALNATIEAARAGAAGKGFAVVADEVKQLANETAKATETIAEMVNQIQGDTSGAVAAIANIRDVIHRVAETQQSISAAVEEQSATTAEITRATSSFATAAAETRGGASQLRELAAELSATGAELDSLVQRFHFR